MAGTSCSSGLNNLLSGSKTTETKLPCWYTNAQTNLINKANTASTNAPTGISGTNIQNAVNTLNSPTNPFANAESTLNSIASGAAHPFTVCATTGQVNPDTNTALGGLFAAQRQQLCQMLPQAIAPVQAGAVGSGNFGSLRGQTAINSARANAFDTLAAQQMQAALQNQATGATAAGAEGNVGAQCVSAQLNTGTAQLNAPYQNAANYANILSTLNAPKTCITQCQLSPLSMISTLAGVPGAFCKLTQSITGTGAGTLTNLWKTLFGGSGGLCCSSLTKCKTTGYCKSSCGNLIVCKNDQSGQYSGCSSTATSTGGTSAADVANAAQDAGYTSYDPNQP